VFETIQFVLSAKPSWTHWQGWKQLLMVKRQVLAKETKMARGSGGSIAPAIPSMPARTPLNRRQIVGFWAGWFGWMLDGMDSIIYVLVLGPALTELLPRSGIEATPANVGYVGSLTFGLFLVGWGLSFIWGPISDKFGRTRSLAATILSTRCSRGRSPCV
jgi:hypothetical protein